MVNYTIINGTGAQLTAVNAGSVNVDPLSYKDGVTLTNTELAALLTNAGVAVLKDLSGVADATQLKRVAGIASLYVST